MEVKMYRVRWKFREKTRHGQFDTEGHGEWTFSKENVLGWVAHMESVWGKGTHWIEEKTS